MATGYVKSITINVENRETPEIVFTLIPADGSKADDVFYSFSGSPSEPHAYSTIEKVVTMAFQMGIPLSVNASDDEIHKEVLIVSISR
jgi:hypothetical protein